MKKNLSYEFKGKFIGHRLLSNFNHKLYFVRDNSTSIDVISAIITEIPTAVLQLQILHTSIQNIYTLLLYENRK